MRLFHFSEEPSIASFMPRPTLPPKERPPGKSWLNDPLVWAIEEWHEPMYLFPRDCPRILLWQTAKSSQDDIADYLGSPGLRMVAYVESYRLAEIESTTLFRYELPVGSFEDLEDAGMWVSREAVSPLCVDRFDDLPAALEARDVELRPVPSLRPLAGVWQTSLHASGIRLANARDWRFE